jgi:hypothetical protein
MWKLYRKKMTQKMRPYTPGELMDGISVSAHDLAAGSPKLGDMIAHDTTCPSDQWLVSQEFFTSNYEEVQEVK